MTDPQKRLVPGLAQDDFTVFDNEKPQPVVYFDNSIRPINVVVMLDTSGSMTLTIDLLKQAAEQFLIRLLPEDKARVGAFNDKIQFNARWSNNRDQLITDAKNLDYGNGTRLWDAVGASLDELKSIDGRKVILIFTDGDDTESRVRLGTVMDRARAEEVMVYAIGLESTISTDSSGSDQAGQRPAQDRGRDRRRLLRADESERARADVHEGRAGAAQPVHDRLHADGARQQGAQARGEDEAAGHDGAGAPQLPGGRRQDVRVWEVARPRCARAVSGPRVRRIRPTRRRWRPRAETQRPSPPTPKSSDHEFFHALFSDLPSTQLDGCPPAKV